MATADTAMTVTVEEAARRLGIGRSLAYRLIGRGELPVLRLGSPTLVPTAGLEDFVAARSSGGPEGERPRRGQDGAPPPGPVHSDASPALPQPRQ